jgi:hypothetical protein
MCLVSFDQRPRQLRLAAAPIDLVLSIPSGSGQRAVACGLYTGAMQVSSPIRGISEP